MKLSVEGKVAASVAAAFLALTVGVIAQGNSEDQGVGPNGYGPTKNAKIRLQISVQRSTNSLTGWTSTNDNRPDTQ